MSTERLGFKMSLLPNVGGASFFEKIHVPYFRVVVLASIEKKDADSGASRAHVSPSPPFVEASPGTLRPRWTLPLHCARRQDDLSDLRLRQATLSYPPISHRIRTSGQWSNHEGMQNMRTLRPPHPTPPGHSLLLMTFV